MIHSRNAKNAKPIKIVIRIKISIKPKPKTFFHFFFLTKRISDRIFPISFFTSNHRARITMEFTDHGCPKQDKKNHRMEETEVNP